MDIPAEARRVISKEWADALERADLEYMLNPDHCPSCRGERLVCENHPELPWNYRGCTCGAGMPCPLCNPTDHDHPPATPKGWKRRAATDLVLMNEAERKAALSIVRAERKLRR